MDINDENNSQVQNSQQESNRLEMEYNTSGVLPTEDHDIGLLPNVEEELIDVFQYEENDLNSPAMTLDPNSILTQELIQNIYSVMEELNEDIEDDSDNEIPNNQLTEDPEEDDNFLVDYEESSNVNEDYVQSTGKYKTLEEMTSSPEFHAPVNTPVKATVGEIVIMIVRYALLNALSLTAIYELFCLINCIF
ncbi:uncharacterized protein LOC122498287 [Leptopilina heterotoma]|uniref:uncharacterized protein LOC122498287 n=1 Tax=Leptopilina heterotoma TaxID=63436 RepID=UPI001CA93DFD|nr:uncharacterized protein LOC122498287 [Leptopilina heterotoma]